MMKKSCGVLYVAGILLPYWQFLIWIAEHGVDVGQLLREASGGRIGAFEWLDVLASGVVLLGFIVYDGRRPQMRRLWMPILGTCLVGVSL
jgi:hypothetical protein